MSLGLKCPGTEMSWYRNVSGTEMSQYRNVHGTEMSRYRNVSGAEMSRGRNVPGTEMSRYRNVSGTEMSVPKCLMPKSLGPKCETAHITTITQVIHLLPMPLVFESFLFFLCFLYFQQSDKYYENKLLITYIEAQYLFF